jgi:hypothetical protein
MTVLRQILQLEIDIGISWPKNVWCIRKNTCLKAEGKKNLFNKFRD